MSSSFYVFLPSNSSFKFFPDNTLSDYTTQLAHSVELDGRWEVALTEISFPKAYQNTPTDFTFGLAAWQVGGRPGEVTPDYDVVDHGTQQLATATIPPGEYSNASFIQVMNKGIQDIWQRQMQFDSTLPPPEFQLNPDNNKIAYISPPVPAGKATFVSTHTKLRVKTVDGRDMLLYKMLGFVTTDTFRRPLQQYNRPQSVKSLGSEEMNTCTGENLLYVYTNISAPVAVGDHEVSLLRSLPLGQTSIDAAGLVTERFTDPYYMPLAVSRIETITVALRDDVGRKVHFFPGRVQITLRFRKVQ